MVVGPVFPASFANSSRQYGAMSHIATKNDIDAKLVRYAALEAESLRQQDHLKRPYEGVVSKVDAKRSPRSQQCASGGTNVLLRPAEEDAALQARLLLPSKQHNGQVVCPGDDSRKLDAEKFDTDGSAALHAWDKLNISRSVVESHDVFLTTAGRVRPYVVVAESIPGGCTANSSSPPCNEPSAAATTSPRPSPPRQHGVASLSSSSRPLATSPRGGNVVKGLAALKDNTRGQPSIPSTSTPVRGAVSQQVTSIADRLPSISSPRALQLRSRPSAPLRAVYGASASVDTAQQ